MLTFTFFRNEIDEESNEIFSHLFKKEQNRMTARNVFAPLSDLLNQFYVCVFSYNLYSTFLTWFYSANKEALLMLVPELFLILMFNGLK